MKKIILILAILAMAAPCMGAVFDVTLQWDENTEPDLAVGQNPRYKIYYKTGSSGAGLKNNYIGLPDVEPFMADEGVSPVPVTVAMDESDDSDIVQFTLHNLDDQQVYYFAVTALDNSGNESELSEEISFDPIGYTDVTPPGKPGRPGIWAIIVGAIQRILGLFL